MFGHELLQNILDNMIGIILGIFTIVILLFINANTKYIGMDEQVVIETLTAQTIVNGPRIYFLPFLKKSYLIRKATSLSPTEYCCIKNTITGNKRVEQGPKLLFLKPYDTLLGSIKTAFSLKANEYVRLQDNITGKVRILRGEMGSVIPGPDEVIVGLSKQKALDLKVFEFIKIQDKKTGAIRIERGEKVVFLGPFEEFVGSKESAVDIDEETAVLVRNKRSGQQNLVTEKMMFFPSADEEILEVRKLEKLADFEACIIRQKDGKDLFYFGTNDEQRSFFLPPYCSIVPLKWSRGRRRERKDLIITKIDLRPVYMSFEFNCRTNDNVELILEGSFFWEIINLKAMVKFTSDTTGDICNHARSRFIELVSKVTLQEFMSKFNTIAENVHQGDDSGFYEQRGVKIHSLEVTGYRCAEQSTANILRQIIQETTNRMNKLQQQESENEVQLHQINGDIEEEKAKTELIKIKTANSNALSNMEGLAEAERVKSFLNNLSSEFPEMDLDTKVKFWSVLRKEDALRVVSSGNAKLYFTPNDVNLSIEDNEHTHKTSHVEIDNQMN